MFDGVRRAREADEGGWSINSSGRNAYRYEYKAGATERRGGAETERKTTTEAGLGRSEERGRPGGGGRTRANMYSLCSLYICGHEVSCVSGAGLV